MQVPHVLTPDPVSRRLLAWRSGGVTLLLGAVTLLYAGWVLVGGSEGQTMAARHALALLAFVPVSGASVLLADRARRLPALDRRARRAWTLIWLALLANWLGGSLYTVLDDVFGETPLAVLANGAFAVFYPLMLLALASFATVPRTWQDRCKLVLDAALVVIPGAMILWTLLPDLLTSDAGMGPWSTLITLVYPFCDLAILAGLTVVLLQREAAECDRALRILTLGVFVYIVGDVLFARLVAGSGYKTGTLPDVFWLAASWLFALAAHERSREATRPAH